MGSHCNILTSDTNKHLPRSAAAIRVLAVFPNVETDLCQPEAAKDAQKPDLSETGGESVRRVADGERNDRPPSGSIRRLSSGRAALLKPRLLLGTVFAFLIVAGALILLLSPSDSDSASVLGSVTANAEIYPTLAPPRHLMPQTTTTHTNEQVRSSKTATR